MILQLSDQAVIGSLVGLGRLEGRIFNNIKMKG